MLDTYARTDLNVVHTVPADDFVEHKTRGFGCVCGPKVHYRRSVCGCEDTWVVAHQALAGRT